MHPKATRFEEMLEAVPEALVGMDQNGKIRFVNSHTESQFGYARDQLIGQSIDILVPQPFGQIYAEHRQTYFADPRTRSLGLDLELAGRQHDGTEFPITISVSYIDTGDVLLAIRAASDVTQRKEAVKNAQLLAAVVEHSGDAIIGATIDGIITSWNPAAERMFGYRRAEIVGRSGDPLNPDGRTEATIATLAKVRGGQPVEQFETSLVRKDGRVFPVSVSISPVRDEDGQVTGLSAIVRDETEQRRASAVAEHLAAFVNFSDDAIIGNTLDGIITSWNPAAERMFGYSSDEMIGKSARRLISAGRTGEYTALVAKVSVREPVKRLYTQRVRKDGEVFPVSLTVSPICDQGGAVVGASVICRDVLEQRKAFDAARAMIESSLDSLVSISPDGMITDVNEATVKVTGVPRDQLMGTAFSDYFTDPDQADRIYQLVFADGMAADYPLTMRHRDETLTEVLFNASVYHDAQGHLLGAFAAARDVTKQVQAASAAREMLETSQDSFVSISPAGKITDANEATVTLTGVPREELVGTAFSGYFTEPDKADAVYQRVLAHGMAGEYPLTILHRDGRLVEVLYYATAQRDIAGHVLGVFAAARDVTMQVQAANAARGMLESSPDSLVSISPDGKITDANEATVKVTGVPRQELIGTAFSDYFTDPEKANRIYQLVFEQGSALDYPLTMRHRDGTLTEVRYNASVYHDIKGHVLGVFAAARDVTKQVQAFEAARSMLETSQDALVAISPEAKITDANEATVRLTGVPRVELIGTSFSDYFTDPDSAEGVYQRVFAHGMAGDYPLAIHRRDGSLVEVMYYATVYRDAGGNVLGVFAAVRDVTAQARAFEAARSMIESSLDSLVAISPAGKITDANQATVKITGVPRQELIGTTFSDYFSDPGRAEEIYQKVFAEGMAVDYPLTIRHRDGTRTEVLYNASVYGDADGNPLGVFAAARDVTKDRARVAELERFQQLSVGRELKMIELKKEIESLTRLLPAEESSPTTPADHDGPEAD